MLSDVQWLHILAAEADHLVTVEIALSQRDEAAFRDALARAFNSDGFSDIAKAWNHQHAQVIEEVVEKHLYAVGVKHVREWLRDEVEEQLAAKCASVLEQVHILLQRRFVLLSYDWRIAHRCFIYVAHRYRSIPAP